MAAAVVGRNREAFGGAAKDVDPLPPADWVEVEIEASTSLQLIGETLSIDLDLLREYNAELVRGRTPPQSTPYRLKIPTAQKAAFEHAVATWREVWSQETTYEV